MVGEDGVGDARWRPAVKAVESGGSAAGGFPSLAARPLDRIRDFGEELGLGEPRDLSRRPPPLFIAQCDRGPSAIVGWAPPIRAWIKGPTEPLGPVWD